MVKYYGRKIEQGVKRIGSSGIKITILNGVFRV